MKLVFLAKFLADFASWMRKYLHNRLAQSCRNSIRLMYCLVTGAEQSGGESSLKMMAF